MRVYRPETVYVERSVAGSPVTEHVRRTLPDLSFTWIESSQELLDRARTWSPSTAVAKRSLLLAEHLGDFFKPCPGQQSKRDSKNVCCDYYVVNFASNCHMECSYCYLQAYLNFPHLVVYANVDKLIKELSCRIGAFPQRRFRVGTGELADSLALDPLTGYSRHLVEFFASQTNAVLELKTKSDAIDNLLDLEHGGNTVLAWSLNPPSIQRAEEHKTATIEERLEAARRCIEAGYPVAFHFDPIIHYPSWRDDYRELVRLLFEKIPAESIAWISLGALRMPDTLLEVLRKRFPNSLLPLGELVPAADGKLRYFKSIRLELYRAMLEWIARWGEGTEVYACMERPDVWQKTFGPTNLQDEELGDSLVQIVKSGSP